MKFAKFANMLRNIKFFRILIIALVKVTFLLASKYKIQFKEKKNLNAFQNLSY